MSSDADINVFWLKSRAVRAIYYERGSRKMIVQTAHGKFLVYKDIDQDLTHALATHAAPGMVYVQQLRTILRPKLAKMTLSNFMLLRRVRKIARTVSETAPDDHTDRCPDAGR